MLFCSFKKRLGKISHDPVNLVIKSNFPSIQIIRNSLIIQDIISNMYQVQSKGKAGRGGGSGKAGGASKTGNKSGKNPHK